MGNTESTALAKWSTNDVANAVAALGSSPKYETYASMIRDAGVDGDLLASLIAEDRQELDDMFDELEVSSKIHRKVMTRALLAGEKTSKNTNSCVPTCATTTNRTPSRGRAPLETIEFMDEENDNTRSTAPLEESFTSLVLDTAAASELAAKSYGLTSFSSFEDVKGFDDISAQTMEINPTAGYAGVHLCLPDGQHTLASKIRIPSGGYVTMDRAALGVIDHRVSMCSKFVRESKDSFVILKGSDYIKAIGPTYVGHVIYNDKGDRLGAVCHISSLSIGEAKQDEESIRKMSSSIARMAEEQLRLRKQLLSRTQTLQRQVTQAKYKLVNEEKEQGEEIPPLEVSHNMAAMPPYVPNSAMLPFARTNLATGDECEHLPPDLFDMVDSLGMPRPPIGKDDMARVARVEALGLHNMDPNGPLAKQIKNILAMASNIFQCPIVTLSVLNHSTEFLVGCYDGGLELFEALDVRHRDKEGSVFCATTTQGRGDSPCNYVIHKRATFEIPDMWEDEAFKQNKSPVRAYVATPIITSDGFVVANLCMSDVKPRYDFTRADHLEFERIALLLSQNIENWELRRAMDRLVEERKLLDDLKSSINASARKRDPPTGDVTIVLTDIQGSTALWEANSNAMKKALMLHDQILRKCNSEHNGYEIKTEGDAFHLAFHDPVDAISFALQAQVELYQAPWSDDILALADAAVDENALFRGLRVRMGIHHGPSIPQTNEVSGRASYSGETFRLAKSIEALCYGGQILASAETWRMVSELSEQLGHPQVIDYGEYILMSSELITDGIIAKSVVQLIPKHLAFDYFQFSGSNVDNEALAPGAAPEKEGANAQRILKGRQFPRSNTKRRLSTSFLDAPNVNGEVTMMFVYPKGTDKFTDELADKTFSVLTKVVRSLLLKVTPPGYECQEDKGKWMIAFDSLLPAVNFGLLLKEAIGRAPFDDEVDTETLISVGIHSGAFSGMCPHPKTGRADYYGPVVNRAARVTAATDPGSVCVGVPVVDPEEKPQPPDLGPSILAVLVGIKELKGLTTGMALFCCEDKVRYRVSTLLKDARREKVDAQKPSKP